jgi:hypothetical protein
MSITLPLLYTGMYMNNDSYNETVTRNGKIYHYDPDRDCYYAYTEESTISRWSWVIVGSVLAVACWLTA